MKFLVPEVIKHGPHNYAVGYDDKLEERTKKIGFTDLTNGLILIEPRQMSSAKTDVLIHENLHIINFFYCNNTLSEEQIAGITTGLHNLLSGFGVEFDWSAIEEK